jgi:hypothetical protein
MINADCYGMVSTRCRLDTADDSVAHELARIAFCTKNGRYPVLLPFMCSYIKKLYQKIYKKYE